MRTSRFHLGTIKEAPADAELASHRLMLRAGYVRRLATGIYTWLPVGPLDFHELVISCADLCGSTRDLRACRACRRHSDS